MEISCLPLDWHGRKHCGIGLWEIRALVFENASTGISCFSGRGAGLHTTNRYMQLVHHL